MTVGDAMTELWLYAGLLACDRKKLTAHCLERMKPEVREALASATSEEIGKVRLYDIRQSTPQRVRPLVFSMKALLLALLLQGSAVAIELPEECRVPNKGPMCAWAALETLARAHGINRLYGLRDDRIKVEPLGLTYDSTIKDELDRRGVRYELRPQWSFDRTLLRKYANTLGVMVALKPGNNWSNGCHAIAVTRYDDEWVEFYDCNKPTQHGKPKIWRCPRWWFDEHGWMGSSVVVFREEWH